MAKIEVKHGDAYILIKTYSSMAHALKALSQLTKYDPQSLVLYRVTSIG